MTHTVRLPTEIVQRRGRARCRSTRISGVGLEYPMLATYTVTEEIAYHSSSMAGL
jgi:hypothetical protein